MGINKAIPAALLLCCISAVLAAQTRAADALQEAESLLEKQQYDQAETRLQTLVQAHPRDPQAWFDLGFAQSHLGKTAEAIAAYKKATELSPKWFEAQLNLGVTQAKAGNFPDAAAALSAAVQLKPTRQAGAQQSMGKAWLTLAQVLEQSDPKQAVSAYEQAIKLDPNNPEPVLASGKLMERSGDLAGAEQQYRSAAGLGNIPALQQLVDFYLKQKRFPEAENWLRKYLEKTPQDSAAQVQLGRVLAAEGKTQEAITNLEMIAGSSTDPQLLRELAGLYAENKQYDKAAPLFQQLLKNNPSDADLHWNLGEALLHQHQYADAEAELIKALQLNSRLADAYWELAYAADQNKHYELAIRALDARARFLPESAATYWLRATSYDNLRAYKPAAENYKLFLQASAGKSPDQEFQARHRLKAIAPH